VATLGAALVVGRLVLDGRPPLFTSCNYANLPSISFWLFRERSLWLWFFADTSSLLLAVVVNV